MSARPPDPTDAVEQLLADGPPGESIEARRVLSELHESLFGRVARPVTLSRYVVLERIAAGGLGVVYAAYDPQLDRKVAIKLLHARPRGAGVVDMQARLWQEARALARVADPHVVTVFDVGSYEDSELEGLADDRPAPGRGVFVVMELVEGIDLAAWCAAAPRGWRRVLDVFIEAGRGLAAAHAAGIVHRDFKPANVIVGSDGRTRVLDFGLARALAPETPDVVASTRRASSAATGTIDAAVDPTPARLTDPGSVLGTPAYMAPEQHFGRTVDARTDEYAFFVALYEAVWGALPFASTTTAALGEDKQAARFAPPPKGRRVPQSLQRAIVRGLAPRPGDRFATMLEALRELERIRGGWRRRAPWLVAGSALVLGAAMAGASLLPEPSPCAAIAKRLDGVWDPATRTAVADGLAGTGVDFAETTAQSVTRTLDAYAAALVQARTEACEATLVREAADLQAAQRTALCLDQRLERLRALTTLLRDPDSRLAEHAVDAASSLPPIATCEPTPARPGESYDTAPVAREEFETRVARAEALRDAGAFVRGVAAARDAVELAERLADPRATSRARRVLGQLHAEAGDLAAAEAATRGALLEAERAGLVDEADAALVDLLAVVGASRGRYPEGERLAEWAGARLAYRGRRDALDAKLALEIGRLHHAQGRNEEAYAALQQALGLAREVWGEEHPRVADVYNELGNSLDRQGRFEEAMADYEHALRIRVALLGDTHPRVGASLNNIANIEASLGHDDRAQETYERALAIYESSLGPDHPSMAALLNNLAIVHSRTGRLEEALREHRRALAIRERTLAADHPWIALGHNNIGTVLASLGQHEEALAEYELALDLRERSLGPEHPDVAHTLDNVAVTLGQLGRAEEGIEHAERALAIREAALGRDHPDVATSELHLATLFERVGRLDDAGPLLRHALEVRRATLGDEHPGVTAIRARLADDTP